MTQEQQAAEIVAIREQIAALNEKIKGALHRIDEQRVQSESIHKLAVALERNTVELAQMRKDMEAVRSDIEEVKFKPGRRWDLIVSGMISAGVAALVAYIIKGGI